MKNKRLIYSAFLSGILIAAIGCSENEQSVPLDENELIELQVSPKVTLTRSAINGGEQTGNGANVMQNIAVYAQSTTTNTDAKKNNYAIYTLGSGTWSNSGTDKIYLSSEDATVYAYYPAYAPGSNGEYATSTALKISGDASATSTIPLTVYEGGTGIDANYTIAPCGNADKIWNASPGSWADNTGANKKLIAAAPGEVDYMWATSSPTQVDNGRGTDPKGTSAALTMNHALALVSFRVYNDGTYHNAGALTGIKLENEGGNTVLSKSNGHTMKISDGTIANGTAQAATYTRKVTNYTLITVATVASATAVAAGSTANADAAAASKKLSMLVLPAASIDANQVKATFTIDAADYDVKLSAPASDHKKWEQGKNYIYTVKLSGQGLAINKVTVTDWTEQVVSGDLEIK